MKLPKVEVEWVDARSVYTNLTISRAKELRLLSRLTVGYLVAEHEDRVIIAGIFDGAEPGDEEDCVEDSTVIPKGWIVALRHLHAARAKKA